ncbi:hypothetical protein [Flavobacterium aurantiibacter]|uniref:Uncharacterized protein n=1 Tax=Flavobacterium aurantiibacter TaxID=2023067 RepID=A0A256A177_9FLAO|nr:hypothetical protein [Flavobacterium aurantiibacter]OYQ47389.1 hypothetical protein CHX27_03180 [Flavobacterium aurantiibacter]
MTTEEFLKEIEKMFLMNISSFKTGNLTIPDKIKNLEMAKSEVKRINDEVLPRINNYIDENKKDEIEIEKIKSKIKECREKLDPVMF